MFGLKVLIAAWYVKYFTLYHVVCNSILKVDWLREQENLRGKDFETPNVLGNVARQMAGIPTERSLREYCD